MTGGRPVAYIGGAHLTGKAAARKLGGGRALGILPLLQIPSHSWQSSSVSGPLVPIWLVIRCALDTRGCETEWMRINCGDHDGVWWAAFSHRGVTLIHPRLGCHVETEMELPSGENRPDLSFRCLFWEISRSPGFSLIVQRALFINFNLHSSVTEEQVHYVAHELFFFHVHFRFLSMSIRGSVEKANLQMQSKQSESSSFSVLHKYGLYE